jgi:hypothetical protein
LKNTRTTLRPAAGDSLKLLGSKWR